MKISYQVQIGKYKDNCEDHALVCSADKTFVLNNTCGELEINLPAVITVADGVGGNPGGYEASKFVVEEIGNQFQKCRESDFSEDLLKDIYNNINAKLIDYARNINGKKQMATTCSSIFLTEDKGILIHSGNTRISVLNRMFIKQLTDDHTTYQWLLDTGNYEAAENCNKCEITSCLGGGTEKNLSRLDTKIFYNNNQTPEVILMTSDGIHEYVSLDFIEDVISNGSLNDFDKTEELIKEALKNGSEDDKTILIIRI